MRKATLVLAAAAAFAFASNIVLADTATPTTPSTPPAQASHPGQDQVTGRVTAFDTAVNSLTLDEKGGGAVTFNIAPTAKIVVRTQGALADLTATDRIRITAIEDIPAGATTITAQRIEVVPAVRPNAKHPAPGIKDRRAEGDIVSLSPLTIRTSDGATIAVTTSATTPVALSRPGAVSDITVGSRLSAVLTGTAPSLVAQKITVLPGRAKH